MSPDRGTGRPWMFLTNHGFVLLVIAREPDIRVRDIAEQVGITERATQTILRDLADAGFVTVVKRGRRNAYEVRPDKRMRHPLARRQAVAELLNVLPPGS